MGLITSLLTLPLAPVRATVALAEQIRRQAEREYYDPVRIGEQLEQIDALRANGMLEDHEAEAMEEELVQRLLIAADRREREV